MEPPGAFRSCALVDISRRILARIESLESSYVRARVVVQDDGAARMLDEAMEGMYRHRDDALTVHDNLVRVLRGLEQQRMGVEGIVEGILEDAVPDGVTHVVRRYHSDDGQRRAGLAAKDMLRRHTRSEAATPVFPRVDAGQVSAAGVTYDPPPPRSGFLPFLRRTQ